MKSSTTSSIAILNTFDKNYESSLEAELKNRYLNYAYSVITSRALPDIRDGLKPVQRRILFAMYNDQQLLPTTKYRKSASVIGEVLGKYHPHGDTSVYEALVRMAQEFSFRYPLIQGQGNFGSQDGDSPAAYRYTECKLAPYAIELLQELSQHTVDYQITFDGTRSEPVVLPARLPNLLINGAQGIAVGMATWIPPHNAREILKACVALIKDPQLSTQNLLKIIQGPDFPTGGEIVINHEDLSSLYEKGQGTLQLRGQYNVEKIKGKTSYSIIISSIPYGINRSAIIQEINNIIIERKILALISCRDESAQDVRIILEVKNDTEPHSIMKYLYQQTKLSTYIHVNFTCLVPAKNSNLSIPKQLSLKECLTQFLFFRLSTISRKLLFRINQLNESIHILEGLSCIYKELEKALTLIKNSKDKIEATEKLQAYFKLDLLQIHAILELKLYRLARLEIVTIQDDLKKMLQERTKLQQISDSENLKWDLIIQEFKELLKQISEERRTQVSIDKQENSLESNDLLSFEKTFIIITRSGWIKRINSFKDLSSIRIRENDQIAFVLSSSTKEKIIFFTNLGTVYIKNVYELPLTSGYGEPIQKLFSFSDQERVISVFTSDSLKTLETTSLLSLTKKGFGFKFFLPLNLLINSTKKKGEKIGRLYQGDEIVGISLITENAPVLIITHLGKKLLCSHENFPILDKKGLGKNIFSFQADEIIGFSINQKILAESDKGKVYTFQYNNKKPFFSTTIQETIILKKGSFIRTYLPVEK